MGGREESSFFCRPSSCPFLLSGSSSAQALLPKKLGKTGCCLRSHGELFGFISTTRGKASPSHLSFVSSLPAVHWWPWCVLWWAAITHSNRETSAVKSL